MPELPAVDSPTVRTHKRQRTWQILVPICAMAALTVAAAVLTASGAATRTRVWADVSLIWLIAPLMVLALLFLAVLIALIYGLMKLAQITPRYTARAQDLAARVSTGTRKAADGAASPFVWLRQAGAVIEDLVNKL